MDVQFTADQQAFVRLAIETGRVRSEREAIQEALSLWENCERQRLEILAGIDAAEASYSRGEGRLVTTREQTAPFAEDIKQRGLARLTNDLKP